MKFEIWYKNLKNGRKSEMRKIPQEKKNESNLQKREKTCAKATSKCFNFFHLYLLSYGTIVTN